METIKFDIMKSIDGGKEAYIKISDIAKRAKRLGAYGDLLSINMDIEAGVQAYNMDIDKLAGFDDFNLMHDIFGIQKRIDRQNHYFRDDCFLPRSARHGGDKNV